MDYDQATDIDDSPMKVNSSQFRNKSHSLSLQIPSSSHVRIASGPDEPPISLQIPSSSQPRNISESDVRSQSFSSIYTYANEVEAHESLTSFFQRLREQEFEIYTKNEKLCQLHDSVEDCKQKGRENLERFKSELFNVSQKLNTSERFQQNLAFLVKQRDDRIEDLQAIIQNMLSSNENYRQEVSRLQNQLDISTAKEAKDS